MTRAMPRPGGMLLGMGNDLGGGREGRREEMPEQRPPHGSWLSRGGLFGQGRACLTPDPLGIKDLRALLCPEPQQLPAAPTHSSQGLLSASGESALMLHPSLRDALSPPSMATESRTVSRLGSACPWEQGIAPEQHRSSLSPTTHGETHPKLHCFTQSLASGRPPTGPPSLNTSRRWKKHLQQPGMTHWHCASTVHMQSCEHLQVQAKTHAIRSTATQARSWGDIKSGKGNGPRCPNSLTDRCKH